MDFNMGLFFAGMIIIIGLEMSLMIKWGIL